MSDASQLLPPGTPITLENCDREPLHLAGAIQPHGALVVCRDVAPYRLTQASDNLAAVLGAGQSLGELVGERAAGQIAAHRLRPGPPGLRPLRIRADGTARGTWDAVVYRPADGRLAVEFERPAEDGEPRHPGELLGAVTAADPAGDDPEALLGRAVVALRELTGYDRVWAYRFESDGHGVVVAEDAAPGRASFLGLHYPASDIPAPARALFLRNAVRVIADADAQVAAITPQRDPETGAHLDLSDSALRAVSPMHILYLKAMGVRASLSVALVVDGELWGLLSAHHYAAARHPGAWARADCELLGQMVSAQLRVLTDLTEVQERIALDAAAGRVLDAVAGSADIGGGLVADPASLLAVCDADAALVCLDGRIRQVGVEAELPEEAVGAIIDTLGRGEAAATDALGVLSGDAYAGALGVPLSRTWRDFIVWLRRPWVEEVRWAHRPKELVSRELGEQVPLGPAGSYENWARATAGRSRPWSPAQQRATADFRAALGTFVLQRAAELAALNAELRRSNDDLDAFAFAVAHDLQQPVRGIKSFAEFLTEDHGELLPADGAEMLGTIIQLADRTTALLLGLLDYARAGRGRLDRRATTLTAALEDVRTLLHRPLTDAGAELLVEQDGMLHVDPLQFEQLLMNLVSNAVKYGGERPVVRLAVVPDPDADPDHPMVRLTVADDGIGIAPEHHRAIFAVFRRLHERSAYGGGSGVGLAIARSIAERHGGSIAVDSAEGRGTTFTVTLPAGP